MIRKTEVRAAIGATLLGAGFLLALPGVIIVLAYGFKASGAAKVVLDIASVTPGGKAAKAAAGKAGGRVSRAAGRPAPQTREVA